MWEIEQEDAERWAEHKERKAMHQAEEDDRNSRLEEELEAQATEQTLMALTADCENCKMNQQQQETAKALEPGSVVAVL